MRGVRWIIAAMLVPAALSGCGGGERQDADEPEGTYKVEVVRSTFPADQRLAEKSQLTIAVRNADNRPIPNVAVTIDSFTRTAEQAGLADPNRPVWIVDRGPRGGTTAYTGTWALGALPAGVTRTFVWAVTAVEPGKHTVDWRVAAGLDGKAKAQLADGGVPRGRFVVSVDKTPADARVGEDGEVIRD